ncbi:MAG: hypothetical protein JW715_02555 [Sedimentisphaerales bacterium]|nr:hypothetical protein [Sedimentisphaerales bacterium]
MENLTEEELRILLVVARSKDSECDFPTLVRDLDLPETKAEYYVCRLSFEMNYLYWIGNSDENVPDRYRLTNAGRQFLLEGSFL